MAELSNRFTAGSVHSIFNKTFNCQFGPLLLTVAQPQVKNLPYGFLCDFDGQELSLFLKPGNPLLINRNVLVALDESFSINLANASVWSPKLYLPLTDSNIEDINIQINKIQQFVKKYPPQKGLGPLLLVIDDLLSEKLVVQIKKDPIQQQGLFQIQKFISAVRELQVDRIILESKGLLGFGIGLTPSGDDFLTGFLIVAKVVMSDFYGKEFEKVTREIVYMADTLTTNVSSSYINAASHGYATERVGLLLQTIMQSTDTETLVSKTKDVLMFGASSGSEVLLGMIIGLRLCIELCNRHIP